MADIVERLKYSLGASYSELRKEAAVEIMRLRTKIEAMEQECDALRARIEQMEQQEPVAWIARGGYPVPLDTLEWQFWYGSEKPTLSWVNQETRPLYALPGAKGEEK